MMQDPNPLPWGALDRFQAHFIVKKPITQGVINYLAKTELTTQGHFSSKKILKVQWNGGGKLARILNEDKILNEMIAKQSVNDATIFVEPTDDAVRIRNKWKNHLAFGITKELFEIYDRIAGHVKKI